MDSKTNLIKKAVIPVAGFGTRFLPATKAQPKELLPIIDKPIIHFIVEEIINSSITDIILITGRHKRAIEDYFDHTPELHYILKENNKKDLLDLVENISHLANFIYVRQKEPRGDGDALLAAAHILNKEVFALAYGDEIIVSPRPAFEILTNVYSKFQKPIIGVYRVPKKFVNLYGVIDGVKIEDNTFTIKRIVEKPDIKLAPSNLVAIGRYILTPDILFSLEQVSKKKKKGEIRLVNAFEYYLKEGGEILGLEIKGKRYDCGSKFGYLQCIIDMALQHPEVKNDFKKYLKNIWK